MNYDIYAVAHAGGRSLLHLDRVTNNLANVSTPGYKADRLTFSLEERGENRRYSESSYYAPVYTPVPRLDVSRGPLQSTASPLDLAIDSAGFFTIDAKEGPVYTKSGNFTINRNNQLVTKSGDLVMGDTGPLVLTGRLIQINEDGEVFSDGNRVGRLKIMQFDRAEEMVKIGNGQLRPVATDVGKEVEKPRVKAGYLEMSNVSAMKEMIELIDLQRSMEMYQKAIQTIADFDKLSTGRVGKLI